MHINQLPSKSTVADTDVLPIDDGSVTEKVSVSVLRNKVLNGIVSKDNSNNINTYGEWIFPSGVTFTPTSDTGIVKTIYNNNTYNIVRDHNNGNISISASSAGLYLGYENTTFVNLLNGKFSLNSQGQLTVANSIYSVNSAGSAVVARLNSDGAGNGIYMQAMSDGSVKITSRGANNTWYDILSRANNSNAISASGQWTFSNTITGTITPPSDIRLKTNIQDCKVNALSVINAIQMREFDWKADGRHQSIGMIADELELLDADLAHGGGDDANGGMVIKGIDEFYLIGYLVKAVQELSAKIDELKSTR